MAVFHHGFRRFTEDIDLLVRHEDVALIHEHVEGRGYLPKFRGSKNLRDTEDGVSIKFFVSGEFPGDGRPKAIAFPDPTDVGVEVGGVRCLRLPTWIELEIASGTSAPDRHKDLVDVEQLIAILPLPRVFREELDVSVREEFDRMWTAMNPPRRFMRIVEEDDCLTDWMHYR